MHTGLEHILALPVAGRFAEGFTIDAEVQPERTAREQPIECPATDVLVIQYVDVVQHQAGKLHQIRAIVVPGFDTPPIPRETCPPAFSPREGSGNGSGRP